MSAPSQPQLTVSQLTTTGFVGANAVRCINGVPTDLNEVHRIAPDGTDVVLTRILEDGEYFRDFHVQPFETYSYYAIARNSFEPTSTPSNVVSVALSISSGMLHKPTKEASFNKALPDEAILELFNQEGQKDRRTRESNVLVMPALAKPKITTSPIVGRTLEIPIIVPNSDFAALEILRGYLRSNDLFCYRDGIGTLMFGTFPNQSLKTDINGVATILMNESDYDENVS
jgi:hypothetical protein